MSIAHVLPAAPKPLAKYIETGNTEQVRKILTENLKKPTFDINAHEPDGHTPLELACTGAHIDIIKALVDHKADVNTNHKKESPLFFAILAKMNAPQAVEYLLSQKADPNHQLSGNAPQVVEYLLSQKADPNHQLSGNAPQVVEYLLSQKADPNHQLKNVWSPLCMAADSGNVPITQSLLNYKADPNFFHDIGKSTPTHIALSKGHIDIAKSLIIAKAKINGEYNPLLFYCKSNLEAAKFLIAIGATLTPPHQLLRRDGCSEVKGLLLEAWANPAIVRTRLLLEETEKPLIASQKQLLKYCLFLHDRLSNMESLLEEQKDKVSAEDADQLQGLIDRVKNMKLQLNPPSLRLQARACVLTHGESSSAPQESVPLSSSSCTLLASPSAEAATQSAEAAQLSSSTTPARNSTKRRCIVS
jgi:ankyrin repeat protein